MNCANISYKAIYKMVGASNKSDWWASFRERIIQL